MSASESNKRTSDSLDTQDSVAYGDQKKPRPEAPEAPEAPVENIRMSTSTKGKGPSVKNNDKLPEDPDTAEEENCSENSPGNSSITCDIGKDSPSTKISKNSTTVQPEKDGRPLILRMQTSQCLQFKSLIECLKELLIEVNVDFIQDKGMRLVSIDPGRVGMIHLDVNNIEYFYAKGTVTAGISMRHLYHMIRSMTSGDFMEWRIYEDEPHRMEIELSNSERRTKTVNSIKLLDLDEEDIVIPQVEFDRVVSMPSSELSKHVREMATVSPYITVRGTRTTLELIAEGEMSRSHITIEPTASGLNWRHSEEGDDIEGKYFAKYIEKFTKNSLANNVELFLKKNYPLIMRFEVSIGCLRCCIAPIEDK